MVATTTTTPTTAPIGTSSSSYSSGPILGLRLKTPSMVVHRRTVADPVTVAGGDKELMVDQVRLLHCQDKNSYNVNDYLARRRRSNISSARTQQHKLPNHTDHHEEKSEYEHDPTPMDVEDSVVDVVVDVGVDAVCREKMCEWSYRVCDHFHVPRDMVAISMNYLDRFLDRCQVDRPTFKLAAMTSLYMANKICGIAMMFGPSSSECTTYRPSPYHHHHNNPLTIQTLANLSRGEFETCHIAEMETILLSTLGWKVNPPTIQAFIDSFIVSVLPSSSSSKDATNQDTIYQRAIFFAELAVYDYTLVTEDRALLAISSILNAMEGITNVQQEAASMMQQEQHVVDEIYKTFFGMTTYEEDVIETCRNRLWYIYGNSAQYEDEERRLMYHHHHQQQQHNRYKTADGANNNRSLLSKNTNFDDDGMAASSSTASKTQDDGDDDGSSLLKRLSVRPPRSPVSVAD